MNCSCNVNVSSKERAMRVIVGLLALGFAIFNWSAAGLAIMAAVVGAVMLLTGLVGFCPLYAMLGRKLNKEH